MDLKQAEVILARMKSLSIEERLEAINEAKKLYSTIFNPTLDDHGWAKAAQMVVSFYNIIRDELQVKMISVKRDLGDDTMEAKAKAPKVKVTNATKPKSKPPQLDMASMMAAFVAAKAKGELG